MQNSMVMITFSVFDKKHPFLSKFGPKYQNCQLESVGPHVKKFNVVKSSLGYTQRCEFSVLDRKHPFWTYFAQKMKTVSLS